MSNALLERIAQQHAAAVAALPASVVPRQRRRAALQALSTHGLPTARDENWRYANLRPLEQAQFTPAAAVAGLTAAELPPAIEGHTRYVFVDGVFAPALSQSGAAGRGIEVRALAAASDADAPDGPDARADGAVAADEIPPDTQFALLNEAFATDGARVVIAPTAEAPACIELLFVACTDAAGGTSYPRLQLQVQPRARLVLIERHVSVRGDAHSINAAVDVAVEDGAAVDHYRVQDVGIRSVWMDTLSARIGRNATYHLHAVNLGALSARSTAHVRMEGEGAQLTLNAASVAGGRQVHDSYALVEHVAAHAHTEETFRGIAGGRGRVAFNGKITVHAGAQGTDSRQSLRGLLAEPGAEVDVRPQLQIDTDDVQCVHGATAGQLDETMLFYLLARGIDRDTARQLLEWAFLEDVVAKIAVPELRRQIERTLAGQMGGTRAAGPDTDVKEEG